MKHRKKPLELIVDGLPAHKGPVVREYIQSLDGKLTLNYLPGYAPELNPDELVWSHVKRTGTGKKPLKAGEKLQPRVDADLLALKKNPALIRAFFEHPNVSYIVD